MIAILAVGCHVLVRFAHVLCEVDALAKSCTCVAARKARIEAICKDFFEDRWVRSVQEHDLVGPLREGKAAIHLRGLDRESWNLGDVHPSALEQVHVLLHISLPAS